MPWRRSQLIVSVYARPAQAAAALGLIIALTLVGISRLPWNWGFNPNNVGSAGEWFGGVGAFVVFAWACAEPSRQRKRDRERDLETQNRNALLDSIGAIRDWPYRPGASLPRDFHQEATALHNTIEVNRQLVSDSELAERMRVAQAALHAMAEIPHNHDAASDSRVPKILKIVEDCNGSMIAAVNQTALPPWQHAATAERIVWDEA